MMGPAEVEALKEENARLTRELKQRGFELSVLSEITGSISYALNYDDLIRIIVQSLHKLINYDFCVSLIIRPREKEGRMVIYAACPISRATVERLKERVIAALNTMRAQEIKKENVRLDIKGEVFEDSSGPEPEFISSFDVPFFVRETAVGILNISSVKEFFYQDEEIKLLYTIASQASAAAERLQSVLDRELDKMKDDFVALVSHELRTPLVGIKGATENLLDEIPGALNPSQKDCLGLTKRNIERLERLICDLLDVSRIEAGKIRLDKKSVDINAIISEALRLLEGAAAKNGLKLLTSFAAGLPLVEADPDRITQVITNLAGNAIKFTPCAGQITVSTLQEGKNIRVDVADTGSGISKEDAQKVFDKFYQIHAPDGRQKKGTGLGLTICKGIVEEHGGKIWVEPASGGGSRFSFVLPL